MAKKHLRKIGLTTLDPATNPDIQREAMKFESENSKTRFLLALCLILIGLIISILFPAINFFDINMEYGKTKIIIANCTPGVLLMIIGTFIAIKSKYEFAIKKKS